MRGGDDQRRHHPRLAQEIHQDDAEDRPQEHPQHPDLGQIGDAPQALDQRAISYDILKSVEDRGPGV